MMTRGLLPVLGLMGILCAGCDTLTVKNTGGDGKPRPTQIVTYPDHAIIHVDGKYKGKSPVLVTLPQGTNGMVTGRMTIEAIPTSPFLNPQVVVFSPSNRVDRVPDRYMIDLTLPAAPETALAAARSSERSFITSRVPWPQPSRSAKGQPTLSPRARQQKMEAEGKEAPTREMRDSRSNRQ